MTIEFLQLGIRTFPKPIPNLSRTYLGPISDRSRTYFEPIMNLSRDANDCDILLIQ